MAATFDLTANQDQSSLKSGLRIIVTAPPGSGQVWLTHTLASIYDLDVLSGDARPVGRRRGSCQLRADGQFAQGAIFRTHSAYGRKLVERWQSVPANIVTIVRDPYDLFAAMHHHVQTSSHPAALDRLPRRFSMAGNHIEDEQAIRYLTDDFDRVLRRSVRWALDDRVHRVRFEDLRDDPVRTIAHLTAQIEPVPPGRIEYALQSAIIERRRSFDWPGNNPTSASLNAGHLDVFRR
ncbi:MAG: sulfotransferase, partial [Thermomicrobiales bacterium]